MGSRHKAEKSGQQHLELVLKCDSAGSLEAVTAALTAITVPGVDISLTHAGIGAVSKSDVMLAETSSRIILGYQVGVMPSMERILREHRVDVRLYEVIYTLTSDIESLARELLPAAPSEDILGAAQVIKIFKSTRRGVIIGCEVTKGQLTTGMHFRIISAMGPVYSGTISSMHRDDAVIQKALPGQQVGIKITNFSRVHTGDLVEAFRTSAGAPHPRHEPSGEIIRR